MIAVGRTTAGAASGETAEFRGAEGFTISDSIWRADNCQRHKYDSYDQEIGGHPISFFMGLFIIVKNLTTEAFSDNPCADAFTGSVDGCTCTSRTISK
ncbi:hypothetical protein LLH32_07320 [Bacillus nakamurai]|nr:hypothetical protein [Bacillus nakamurai]